MVDKGSEAEDIGLMVQLLFLEFFLTPAAHGFHSCIGYIGHPFVKEGPWAFIATLSLVARWYSAIDRGGEWFSYTGENRHLWTEAIKEGMQRLLERSAKDFFRHDATNWMDFVCQ